MKTIPERYLDAVERPRSLGSLGVDLIRACVLLDEVETKDLIRDEDLHIRVLAFLKEMQGRPNE